MGNMCKSIKFYNYSQDKITYHVIAVDDGNSRMIAKTTGKITPKTNSNI